MKIDGCFLMQGVIIFFQVWLALLILDIVKMTWFVS
jgi:hypothetical protein